MRLFKRQKENKENGQSDGPEEWARKAREVDARIKRERAAEAVGDSAVHSLHAGSPPTAEQHEGRKGFSDVEELSEDYLRFLSEQGARGGKYIRLGDSLFVSPGHLPGREGSGLMHKEILERALGRPEIKERMIGAEALEGASEATIGPDGLTDAGKFDIFFLPDNKPREDGIVGRFRVFGASASFGMAEKDSREKTVQIATQALGPHMIVEDAPHMALSLS